MKTTALTLSLFLFTYCGKAQNRSAIESPILRGKMYTGISLRLTQPFFPAHQLLFNNLQAQGGYFVLDNWSVDASIRALGVGSDGNSAIVFADVELGFGYWVPLKKNLLLQLRSGVHLVNSPFATLSVINSQDLKIGAGLTYRLPGLPTLGINLGADYYINPKTFQPRQITPQITLGISFFFGKARNKKSVKIID